MTRTKLVARTKPTGLLPRQVVAEIKKTEKEKERQRKQVKRDERTKEKAARQAKPKEKKKKTKKAGPLTLENIKECFEVLRGIKSCRVFKINCTGIHKDIQTMTMAK